MLTLRKGRHLRIRAGSRVYCLSGTLWITQGGDPCDHFVSAGANVCLEPVGIALAEAWGGDAILSIDPMSRGPRWWTRMHGLLSGNATCNPAPE